MPDFRPFLPRIETFKVTGGCHEYESEGPGCAIAWLGFVIEVSFSRIVREGAR